MPKFKFAKHETYPEDDYTKEAVHLDVKGEECIFRLIYVRKVFKNGGSSWDMVSAGVSENGKKKYLKGAQCSDNFFDQEVKEYLKNRGWEKGQKPQSSDELPF